jgi:hypothetical protein
LRTVCKEFDIPGKLEHKPSGHVDLEEIEYRRQDVRATVGLLNALKKEYDLHPIDLGPDEMFSPASVAKSYLEKLTISYPSEKSRDVNSAYGISMQSYFGGRAECRIRNWEVPVCPVDFMSQYPTVNELLDNWSVLTAQSVSFPDATEEIRQFLSNITLEHCFNRKLWQEFKFFALVRPERDILPVRRIYNGTTQNIGINYLSSKESIWYAGPDIITSILLTGGKIPHIEKVVRRHRMISCIRSLLGGCYMAMFPWIGQSVMSRFIEVQQDMEDDEGFVLQSTLARFFTLSLAALGALTLQTSSARR